MPAWDSFTEKAGNPRHQEAMRRLRQLLDGEAAGMPPLTQEGLARIEELKAELGRSR